MKLLLKILMIFGLVAKHETPIAASVAEMKVGIRLCESQQSINNIKKLVYENVVIPFKNHPELDRNLNDLYGKIQVRELEIMVSKMKAET